MREIELLCIYTLTLLSFIIYRFMYFIEIADFECNIKL